MHPSRDRLEFTVFGDYEGRQIDAEAIRITFGSMPAMFPPDESPVAS